MAGDTGIEFIGWCSGGFRSSSSSELLKFAYLLELYVICWTGAAFSSIINACIIRNQLSKVSNQSLRKFFIGIINKKACRRL